MRMCEFEFGFRPAYSEEQTISKFYIKLVCILHNSFVFFLFWYIPSNVNIWLNQKVSVCHNFIHSNLPENAKKKM